MRNPFKRSGGAGGRDAFAKRHDGVGGFFRSSRHAPPAGGADAASLRGSRRRAHLPGPPGDIHTARPATDTWPGARPGPEAGSDSSPRPTYSSGQQEGSRQTPMGGSDSSG